MTPDGVKAAYAHLVRVARIDEVLGSHVQVGGGFSVTAVGVTVTFESEDQVAAVMQLLIAERTALLRAVNVIGVEVGELEAPAGKCPRRAAAGHARAAALSPERRKEMAIGAANARWAKP